MQADSKAATIGHEPSVEPRDGTRSELDELRASCRRQADVIDALTAAIGTLRRGAQALQAENADLRAQTAGARDQRHSPARAHGPVKGSERIEARFALDVHAPAAARGTVADCLGGRVAPAVLDTALLLVTELVTNSVRHSGMAAGAGVVVTITITPVDVRLDVDDPGRGGAIAPRRPDLETGGFGLNLVQTLSERWGVERAAQGGTRVWAQLDARLSSARPGGAPAGGAMPDLGRDVTTARGAPPRDPPTLHSVTGSVAGSEARNHRSQAARGAPLASRS